MKVILEKPEIEDAIKKYIGPTGWGIPVEGKEISIEINAHRGEKGFSAEVELKDIAKSEGTSEPGESADEDEQGIKFDFAQA